jgi:molecular chaperone DnaK (HSP70)
VVARQRPTVAVDFGTSTSFVAERTGREPATIRILNPVSIWMPSLAAWDGRRVLVGEAAADAPPDQVIRSVKRAITDQRTQVRLGGLPGGPELPADVAIVAILKEIYQRATTRSLPLKRQAVRFGCPAMWDGGQRRRLLDLAARAGFQVSDATLIDEPVAAGVAWLADEYVRTPEPVNGRLVVFDMGGGTLDIAVMEVAGGERPDIRVLASHGATLAGDRLDDLIHDDIVTSLAEAGFPLESFPRPTVAAHLIRREATAAKLALSTTEEYHTVLSKVLLGRSIPVHYSRDRLEDLFAPQMDLAAQLVTAALRAARLSERYRQSTYDTASRDLTADVDYVLLAGGMSRIPYVRRRLQEMFPSARLVATSVEPDEAIVAGLTDTAGYEKINLHRPAFDFILEWDGGKRHSTLYEAYTPLYEPWQIASGRTRLGYECRGRDLALPSAGRAYLRAVSATGQPVAITVDGRPEQRIPVQFGPHDLAFKIYCDGTVALTDGIGHQFQARVDRWPIIVGRDDEALRLRHETVVPPDPPTAWHQSKEYAPPGIR